MAVVAQNEERFYWRFGDDDCEETLRQALIRLFGHLRSGVVVGHNLQFDFGFITYEAERYGLEGLETSYIDTLSLARRLVAGVGDYRLATLLKSFGLSADGNLHTAVTDAKATQDLFWRLVDEGGYETLADAGLKRLSWGTF